MSILKIEDLTFSYGQGGRNIFQGFSTSFEAGTVYAVVGKSGAGKTTLLSLLAALTKPTGGKILVNDKNIFDSDTYRYRCSDVGIVFQNYNLLPKLNAVENVMLSMDISEKEYSNKTQYAVDLLKKMGLEDYDIFRPILQLSGGQQQRVAIARAISYDPAIILADEPTGNLDSRTEQDILNIFQNLAHRDGKCVIIVTHSAEVASAVDKTITIESLKYGTVEAEDVTGGADGGGQTDDPDLMESMAGIDAGVWDFQYKKQPEA
ncbi:MAG: ABC transporter ATP-binding protein [Eubacteriaceae bacterium]|jgi:putative ABC transport system ATP-binding protein|nr:ABC transporter ATP-binding protein [Eubacteriaceae bacterium]